MSKSKIIKSIAIVVIIILGGYILFGRESEEQISGEPIKIGVVLPLTGIAAAHGENERKGIELAIKEINEQGGIDGRQIQAIFEDDQTEPKHSVSAVNKLISIDQVEVIIGGTWDFLANAIIPVIDENKKILITPSALPDTLESDSPYLFIVHSPVTINQNAFETFLSQFKEGKIVVMVVDNPWGLAHLNTFRKAITEANNVLVKEVILPKFDNNDIQRELTLIKPLRPDAIVSAMNFSDYAVFAKKRVELGISAEILAHYDIVDSFHQGNIPKEFMENIVIYRFSSPKSGFVDQYQKEYGEEPRTYADTAYDAVYVIKQAIENANGKSSVNDILSGLKKITNYDGASGAIDFSENNYPANKVPVLEIFKDGQFVPYGN